MCDVHLVPAINAIRLAVEPALCGECGLPIGAGEPHRYIEGRLDDGSDERWEYTAHDICYELSMGDWADGDGCFVYGGARPVASNSAAPS